MGRPTRKTLSLALGALILFGVGANSQAGWLYVIGAGFVGVIVAGVVLPAASLRKLSASRLMPSAATVGDVIRVEVELRNMSSSSKGPLVLSDDVLTKTDLIFDRVPSKSVARIIYEAEAHRRGVFSSAVVKIRSGAPFGVAIAKRDLEIDGDITVHPRWFPISAFPLLESASTPNEALHERPKRGAGMDFYGLREYRSGDSLRHVHWKSSARGGGILVREYEQQLASRLTVLIDAGDELGPQPHTTLEDSITIAASLVVYALDVGHPVQLFCDSRGGTQHLFEPTKVQALDWLACLGTDGRRGLKRLTDEASSDIYRRSTNVLIFPSTRHNAKEAAAATAELQSLSSRVIAIVLSADKYSDGDSRAISAEEEDSFVSSLSSTRAIVYRVEPNKDMSECLREPALL